MWRRLQNDRKLRNHKSIQMSEAFTIQTDSGKSSKQAAGWRDRKLGAAVGGRRGVPAGRRAPQGGAGGSGRCLQRARGGAPRRPPRPTGGGGRRGACGAQDMPPTHAARSNQVATEQRNATREEKIPRLYLTGATKQPPPPVGGT